MTTIELLPETAVPQTTGRRTPLAWAALAALGCLLVSHLPLLLLHAQQIWLRPQYQFFPLVLIGALILFVMKTRHLGVLAPGSLLPAAALFIAGWLMLATAELLHSSWLSAVAAILSMAAVLFTLGGKRLFGAALPALILLSVAIPPPFELDRTLILALQTGTARWGSQVLDLLGVYHVLAGHVVEVSGRQYLVEEACSGVNSLFSVIACTLFFVFLTSRPLVHSFLLLVAAVAWVLAANVLRVVVITYCGINYHLELGSGWRHETVGFLLFGVAVALVISTDRLLLFLTAPSPRLSPVAADNSFEVLPTRWSTFPRLLAWPVALGFVGLVAFHWVCYGAGNAAGKEAVEAARINPESLQASTLPERFGHWQQQGFTTATRNVGSEFGEASRVWLYQQGACRATLSFDYPYPSWHDLTRCYSGQGWVIEEQSVHGAPDDLLEVKLNKPGYRSGYLLFAELDQEGNLLEARRGNLYLSIHRHNSILQRWREGLSGANLSVEPVGPIFQLQLFVETYTPLNSQGEAEALELFRKALLIVRGDMDTK